MVLKYIQNKTLERGDFTQRSLAKGEYEACVFINCDFSNSDLSGNKFVDCEFTSCNLSSASLAGTTFQDVTFNKSKMLGFQFENYNQFIMPFNFENCILDHSSFFRSKIKGIVFKDSQLRQVDFTECDLTSAIFDHCDLAGAIFDHSFIEKADLRTSFNYSIDPEINRIKKAKFSSQGIAGLLDKFDIEIDEPGISS